MTVAPNEDMRPTSLFSPAFALIASALVACSASSDPTLEANGALESTWFDNNLPSASDNAEYVLALVNDPAFSANDYVTKVGISKAAAAAILNYREGDDPGSPSDDQKFDQLKELDALPYTDLAFWTKVLAYVKSHPGANVCATASDPLYLEIILDGSGSMITDNKWEAAVGALQNAFVEMGKANDPNLAIGLIVFSDQKDPSTMAGAGYPTKIDVPLDTVDPTHMGELLTRLDDTSPSGATPTRAALAGAYSTLKAYSGPPAGKKAHRAVVLLSDGQPTDDAAGALTLAGNAFQNDGVKTFAIGIGPFPSAGGYDPKFMGDLSQLGGTGEAGCIASSLDLAKICHVQVTPGGPVDVLSGQFLQALRRIQKRARGCAP